MDVSVKAVTRAPVTAGAGRPGQGPSSRRLHLWAAACGVLGMLVLVAAGEALALAVAAASSPLFSVGSWIVDAAPGWLKDWTIAVFGTADKSFLFVCLGILLAVVAAGIGLVEYRRPPVGSLALVAAGIFALVVAVTRTDATSLWSLPALAGAILGVIALHQSLRRLRRWEAASRVPARRRPEAAAQGAGDGTAAERAVPGRDASLPRQPGKHPGEADRRSFLRFVGIAAAAAFVVGIGARAVNAGSTAVAAVRSALKLPRPAHPAPPVPAAASLDVPGITRLVTPDSSFYRVDTALQVPVVDPQKWRLQLGGMVEHPLAISFADLMALPMTQHMLTLACVSNEVGGNLVGNAMWLGYPVRELLARAVPKPGADMVLSESVDGWTAGTPLDALTDPNRDALLAVGMNGKPLPFKHGFPVRMVVPGLYGYVSATKWVTKLTVTTFSRAAGYWTDEGWSARGPVKLASRIDTPTAGARVQAGHVPVAGVAWDQHTGIREVHVRVDHGPWVQARLAAAVSADTWRQWVFDWDATPGRHVLQVRATNARGQTQTGVETPPAPNGATGWHTVTVSVA